MQISNKAQAIECEAIRQMEIDGKAAAQLPAGDYAGMSMDELIERAKGGDELAKTEALSRNEFVAKYWN